MLKQIISYFSFAVSLLLIVGCNDTQTYGHLHKDIHIPSGKSFKVLEFDKQYSGRTPLTITLKYETDLPIEDNQELRLQIRDVWHVFKDEADSLKFKRAVLTAQKSFSLLGFEYNKWWSYTFEKQGDSTWTIYNGSEYL